MWSVAKSLQIPLTTDIKDIQDIPFTVSYVIRKRIQVDNLNELPKDKRPPDSILWSDNPKDLTNWLDKVLYNKDTKKQDTVFEIPIDEIEG